MLQDRDVLVRLRQMLLAIRDLHDTSRAICSGCLALLAVGFGRTTCTVYASVHERGFTKHEYTHHNYIHIHIYIHIFSTTPSLLTSPPQQGNTNSASTVRIIEMWPRHIASAALHPAPQYSTPQRRNTSA